MDILFSKERIKLTPQQKTLYAEKTKELSKYDDLTVELIGNWLWVTGNTKEHKETLKKLGFKFSRKKTAWYFKNYHYRKKSGDTPFYRIKEMFESEVITEDNQILSEV